MSGTFGQRPGVTRDGLKAIQDASELDRQGGFALLRPLLGLLGGFAIVGFLLANHVVAMKGVGSALDQHWAQNVGYPEVDDAYKRSGSADKPLERVHNDCKSRSDFVGRNRPKSHADLMSADATSIGQAVTYLSCLASAEPARFCKAPHRAHLLAAVKDYYRLKSKMREEDWMQNAGPFAASRAFGKTGRDDGQVNAPLTKEADAAIVHALKALVVGGYIPRRDLVNAPAGWPNDLDTALRDAEPKRKGCA